MEYRVIITKNSEYLHTLHKCKEHNTGYLKYGDLSSVEVDFPKRFINFGGIKTVFYEILFVKEIEEGDVNRTIRDGYGRLVQEKPVDGKWTILERKPYNYEEKFWVYGHDPKGDRLNIRDIITQILMKDVADPHNFKQIRVIHNKLIIQSDYDEFDMVICKCNEDARRLHRRLGEISKGTTIKNLLFLGIVPPEMISETYDTIVEKTGWAIEKVRRTTARP